MLHHHHRSSSSHVPLLLLSLVCIGLTAQSDPETEEVVPRLLSGRETHLSSDHTVRRLRRRGRRALSAAGTGHPDPDNIILSLPVFGRSLYLNLTRDNRFLSGDFVVEERRVDQSAAVSRLSTDRICFYSGSIINHTDSLASLSTCGGLTGLIQIGEDSLFIQPVGETGLSQSFSGLKHQLLRRRRRTKTSSGPDADQTNYCGTVLGERLAFSGFISVESRRRFSIGLE